MSGTNRTVQQPLDTRNVLVVLAMAAIVLAATVAIAWSSANLAKTGPGSAAAPAPLTPPADSDLGSRDLGAASVSIGATHGAPGAYRPAVTSGGSSTRVKDDVAIKTRAAEGFLPGFLFDAEQRRMQSNTSSDAAPGLLPGYLGYADQRRIFSSEGAPAARHAGLRAQ